MKISLPYPGASGLAACLMLASLPSPVMGQDKPIFSESFEGTAYEAGASIEGIRGWSVTSSNPSLDHHAGVVHSGDAPDGAQCLEVKARGTAPTDSTRIVNDFGGDPITLSPGRAYRIAVAMNYVNLYEFASAGGIIFRVYTDLGEFAVTLNSKQQSAGLLRKLAKSKASEHLESGSQIKPDAWYRFVIDLNPAKSPGENATLQVTLSETKNYNPLWEVKAWDLGFSPSRITKIELASNRLADPDGHRLGRFDQIAISEVPLF